MFKILILSNGHGEDLSGSLIAKQFVKSGYSVDALPIVGIGNHYEKEKIKIIGKTKEFRTGGIGYNSFKGRLTEILGGEVFYLLKRLYLTLKIKDIFQKRGWLKIENIKDNNLLKFQYKFLEVNIYWNNFDKILLKSRCCISMAGTAAEQAIGLGKPVIQIEGKGPQFTKTFAEAQRRLLGKYVFCASNFNDKNDQINQTIKLNFLKIS